MTERCSIYEQVRQWVGALKAGMPSAADRFRKGIMDTIRIVETNESCDPVCDKKKYPLPCCCNSFFLDCGTTLVIDEGEGVEIVQPPIHGTINLDGGIRYNPYEGYVGEDLFAYRVGGIYKKVCIEVVEFEAELDVDILDDDYQRVTVSNNCAAPVYIWTGVDSTEGSVIIPRGVPYSVRVECGGCFAEFEPCVVCEFVVSPLMQFNNTAKGIYSFDGIEMSLNEDLGEIETQLQSVIDSLSGDCGNPVVQYSGFTP